MSAATRRPYLTEGVHVAVEDGDTKSCLAGIVSKVGTESIEVWALQKPEPCYVWLKYDDGHRNGTWHYAH